MPRVGLIAFEFESKDRSVCRGKWRHHLPNTT
jgi:hypothetical protein